MGVFQNNLMGAAAAAASAGGGGFYSHQIANSCRFNASASSHMYRTQGTPTNVDKCTISLWVKRGKLGAAIYAFTGSGNYSQISFGGDGNDPDKFFYLQNPGSPTVNLESAAVFRDPSAWYNVVIAQDSTQGTDSNRNKIYINGVIQTDWVSSFTAPFYSTANSDFLINTSGNKIFVGSAGDSANNSHLPFDGYIAEYVFIDGTQNDISDFGETKNGVWIPKDPSGLTFGNNGCYLKFESSSDLGNDSSGNNNDFTVSNVSAHDQMLDSPTFNSDSNGGNFPTYNPLNKGTYTDLSEGNCRADSNTGADATYPSGTVAFPSSGKWYYEQLIGNLTNSYPTTFLVAYGAEQPSTTRGMFWAMRYRSDTGVVQKETSGPAEAPFGTITVNTTGVASLSTGDIVSWYIDMDNKKAWIAKNGSIPNSGDPANGTNPQFSWTTNPANGFTFGSQEYQTSFTVFNGGQDGTFAGEKTAQGNSDDTGYGNFYYDPPTGFLALCTGNMPIPEAIDPAQTDDNFPQKLFGAKTYTGTGSTNAITGLGFQPDWVWIKERGGANNHMLFDSNRGTSKYISSNTSGDEGTDSATMNTFGSDGFTVGSDGKVNASSDTYVSWNWRANGGGSSNSDGATSSTVQADPSSGFSIVTYTGFAGASGTSTVGHGMGVAPNMIIFKSRTRTSGWWTAVPNILSSQSHFLELNGTGAPTDLSSYGTISAPTTSVFTINGVDGIGGESANYVAYCFANVEGYCKVGSYIANGNADNAFVYTGFRPTFVLTKGIRSGDGWNIHDNATSSFNVADTVLQPNTSSAELSNYNIDILSNGFKVRDADGDLGSSGVTYIYLAFAKNPFKYATAR